MKALQRKLLRDVRHLSGQVVTIALVVACGIASYVTLQSTWASLEASRIAYYAQYRFGDVFARLERAPLSVRDQLARLPGVAEVEVRLVESVTVPLEGSGQPPLAQVVSLPDEGQPALGRLVVHAGRLPEPTTHDEVVVLARFAERWKLGPGDTLPVILNGGLRRLTITGLADSPEFIYPMPPDGRAGVDDQRFAVLWMRQAAVAPLFRMEGVFNDAVLRMQPGASEAAVLRSVDQLLDPYGGYPAVGRDRQVSNAVLNEESGQLRMWATVVPAIFLGVSAFLVNVVLSRLVQLQRPEIAALKALGYTRREIGLHFLLLVTVVVLPGALVGIGLGAWLGRELTDLYASIFRFPMFSYALGVRIPLVGAMLSLTAAVLGAASAVRSIVQLTPAEAMRPPAPAVYRPLLLERIGASKLIPPAGRMVMRELERVPLRTALAILGVATGMATLVVGQFSADAFEYLIDLQFSRVTRETLAVSFHRPTDARVVGELGRLPGVWRAEGLRAVPVQAESGPRSRQVPLIGYEDDAELRRVLSRRTNAPITLPPDGVVMTETLAGLLRLKAGEPFQLQRLDGDRRRRVVRLAGTVDELSGLQLYMRLPALHALLGEERSVSAVMLGVAAGRESEVIRRLHERPGVASVSRRSAVVQDLRRQSGESMDVITLVLTAFAATIAVGVVYNTARVALASRSRDFASLRVLGFTRAEISRTLLGELGAQVLAALPLGMLLGYWLTRLVVGSIHAERFRLPVVLSSHTYAFASVVVLAASTVSALVVRRRLDRLDLIGVLKTRE